MPASFGLWFASFAESIADDLFMLDAAYRISNQCPLGSAAGFGTSFPIDRSFTSGLLGFGDLRYNSMHAMNTRGKMEKIAADARDAGFAGITHTRWWFDVSALAAYFMPDSEKDVISSWSLMTKEEKIANAEIWKNSEGLKDSFEWIKISLPHTVTTNG